MPKNRVYFASTNSTRCTSKLLTIPAPEQCRRNTLHSIRADLREQERILLNSVEQVLTVLDFEKYLDGTEEQIGGKLVGTKKAFILADLPS